MKKKSTSKLAFLSLRLLPGFIVTAFIAFALASSHSVGDTTSSCGPSFTTNWPGAATPSPTQAPLLKTDFYWTSPFVRHPVLLVRGCNATSLYPICAVWNPGLAFHAVVQELRGDCAQGLSGDLLFKFDQDDGHAALAGINGSSWSLGSSLAMQGTSNGGIVSYLAAVGASPLPLRGIQTHSATGDLLNYGLFNGGVLRNEVPYFADLPETPNLISWDDYVGLGIWDKYLITDQDAGRANVAGLHVGGWFDVFGQGTLDSFSRLQSAGGFPNARAKQKVVIGPWGHGTGNTVCNPPLSCPSSSAADAGVQVNGPYDAAWRKVALQDPPNWTDWNALPAVKVYLMNATPGTEWKNYSTWPPPGVQVSYYFTADNPPKLSGTAPTSGQLTFTSNPSSPCPTRGGIKNFNSCTSPSPVPSPVPCGPWDQRPIEARSDVLVFTSDPLPSPGPAHAIVGRCHADVWISTALLDVDVFVRMTDVYPDGRSMLMAEGIQRARYRNGGACPVFLTPNQATQIHVDLGSTAFWLKPLHKLRVIVSASGGRNEAGRPPFAGGYSVNPQNGDEYVGGFGHQPIAGPINVLVGADRVGGDHKSAIVLSIPGGTTPQPDERPPKPTPCPQP